MRRTMRRMAKQQNKSLGQSGRAVLSAKASKHHQLQQHQLLQHQHRQQQQQQNESADFARGLCSDLDSPGSGDMRHVMGELSPKQAPMYKECYQGMLKHPGDHHDGDGSFTRALASAHHGSRGGNPMAKGGALLLSGTCLNVGSKKGSGSSKRKRKDLRICTTGSDGSGSSGSSGMFLPDTPRRMLHTQLLLQLLGSNVSDESFYLSGGGGAKRKKRSSTPANGKNMMLMQSLAMQPSAKATEYSGEQGGMDEQAFNDMDGSFHSFEHLDIDFNEVRSCGLRAQRRRLARRTCSGS